MTMDIMLIGFRVRVPPVPTPESRQAAALLGPAGGVLGSHQQGQSLLIVAMTCRRCLRSPRPSPGIDTLQL